MHWLRTYEGRSYSSVKRDVQSRYVCRQAWSIFQVLVLVIMQFFTFPSVEWHSNFNPRNKMVRTRILAVKLSYAWELFVVCGVKNFSWLRYTHFMRKQISFDASLCRAPPFFHLVGLPPHLNFTLIWYCALGPSTYGFIFGHFQKASY